VATKIMVTGGAGFIGSHVVDMLINAGNQVLVVDSLWEHGGGRLENVNPKATFFQLDVTTPEFSELVRAERPQVISHHAAQHSVKISTEKPDYDAKVNILGLINVLRAAKDAGTRKVIFASSGAIFGTPDDLPINEQTPQRPESPYGITKMTSEHYLRYWRVANGLQYTALRYGNVYGPRQDPNGEAGVIAIFAKRILEREPVRIDWDGEQTKDYVFVQDVARATLLSLSKGDGESICIASGEPISVNQIYRQLTELVGYEVPIERAPRRAGDVHAAYFDVSKAARVLGWSPEVSFDAGIRITLDSFRGASSAG
jgi:UDP-glucose 4-epimerase